MSTKMNWRLAGLAGKPTGTSLDGGLRKRPTSKAAKKRALRLEQKKLYGFYKEQKPSPARHIDPVEWEPKS